MFTSRPWKVDTVHNSYIIATNFIKYLYNFKKHQNTEEQEYAIRQNVKRTLKPIFIPQTSNKWPLNTNYIGQICDMCVSLIGWAIC